MRGGFKELGRRGGLPYGELREGGGEVRFLGLHFNGRAKGQMTNAFSPAAAVGARAALHRPRRNPEPEGASLNRQTSSC
jgi:hypothetical protein